MISVKYDGNKIIFSPRFVSMEMVAILDFVALAKVHYSSITASSNEVKSCSHIEGIQMKKRAQVFLVLSNNTFKIFFSVKNNTNSTSDFLEKKYS